jgi:hypothetical protein
MPQANGVCHMEAGPGLGPLEIAALNAQHLQQLRELLAAQKFSDMLVAFIGR